MQFKVGDSVVDVSYIYDVDFYLDNWSGFIIDIDDNDQYKIMPKNGSIIWHAYTHELVLESVYNSELYQLLHKKT